MAGFGQLAFYGDKGGGAKSGWADGRDYARSKGEPKANSDPFAIHLEIDETMKALYSEAEVEDGYHRDMNVSVQLE